MADYVKPFDATDPNASFVNGNPSSGIPGSIPDGLMFEVWQRELKALIVASGQTPSNNDLTQVLKAIRSLISAGAPERGLVHFATATGSANNYSVDSFSPPITGLTEGMFLEINMPVANTGASTMTFTQFDPDISRALVRTDGSALKQNDTVAGPTLFAVRADGRLSIVNYNPVNAPARNNRSYRSNDTFVVPEGCYFIFAQVWGGGGGGGGGAYNNGSSTGSAGAGGAGGGYDDGFFFVTPGQSIPITVGGGGAGGSGSNNGGPGGTSSIGSMISATGGPGGLGALNGLQGSGSGDGGVGFGGNINGRGAPGGTAFTVTPGSSAGATGGIGGQGSFGGGSPSLNVGGQGSGGNFPGGGANGGANNGAAGTGAPGLVRISY